MQLLDTNVVSEMRKAPGRMDAGVAAWAAGASASDLFLSVITVMEIEAGILRAERKDPGKAAILRAWLDAHVLPAFAQRVLDVDVDVARRCASLQATAPRNVPDAFIAATALVHGMTVVTRNVRDFEAMGVRVLNPWVS